jgi:hypothetical protein
MGRFMRQNGIKKQGVSSLHPGAGHGVAGMRAPLICLAEPPMSKGNSRWGGSQRERERP